MTAQLIDPCLIATFDEIRAAIQDKESTDRKAIADTGLRLIAKLLRKNADYGSSAFKVPRLAPEMCAAAAIRVRMSDKLERLENLLQQPAKMNDESWEDTLDDLAGYIILYKARPEAR